MTKNVIVRCAAVTALAIWSLPSLAQVTVQPPPPVDTQKVIPEKIRPPGQREETLSDKLDKSDGVIRPPSNIDPEITKPAPVTPPSNMPVIPPPGSPGGNPRVEPK